MNESIGERPTTATELLTDRIDYDGWQHTLGSEKSFFVRGVTWVRSAYLPKASELTRYVEALPEHLHEYASFLQSDFNWTKTFSPRQALNAISLTNRKPLKFDKAVLTIVACDLAARRIFDDDAVPSTVFGRMRIEPSLFYIRDFDRDALVSLMKHDPNILETLRDETDQVSRKVFEEMARGFTVTKLLADRTLEIIKRNVPDAPVGQVDWRPRSPRAGPALEQTVG